MNTVCTEVYHAIYQASPHSVVTSVGQRVMVQAALTLLNLHPSYNRTRFKPQPLPYLLLWPRL